MAATEWLFERKQPSQGLVSKNEARLLEASLFTLIFNQLQTYYYAINKDYLRLFKIREHEVNDMIDAELIRCIINDLIASDAYTLAGIACYTQIPEDTIYDILSGYNNYPSLSLSRKLLELHREVRPELYRQILSKMTGHET